MQDLYHQQYLVLTCLPPFEASGVEGRSQQKFRGSSLEGLVALRIGASITTYIHYCGGFPVPIIEYRTPKPYSNYSGPYIMLVFCFCVFEVLLVWRERLTSLLSFTALNTKH